MLKHQVHQSEFTTSLSLLPRSFLLHGHGRVSFHIRPPPRNHRKIQKNLCVQSTSSKTEPLVRREARDQDTITIKAIVTVKLTVGGLLSNLGLSQGFDKITDLFGKSLGLELVSADLDSKTGLEKETVKGYAGKESQEDGEVKYETTLEVPADFGDVGAVLVENRHHKEMFFKNIVLSGFPNGSVTVSCESWVHSKFDNSEKRVFFTNKSYLPSETPLGLKKLREKELKNLRGNGKGERKSFERIYDYDKYNDLGNPDISDDLVRPVLGGKDHPYPRRCRTGRDPSEKDPSSETRSLSVYLPRDESFSEVKQVSFSVRTLTSVLSALVPAIRSILIDINLDFPNFAAIDSLFTEGINLSKHDKQNDFLTVLPDLVKAAADGAEDLLLFNTPELIDRNKFAWLEDEEFSRQTLAGVNPYSIQLVTEWPLKSKLDPEIYGPPESAITKELIEQEIKGIMTVEEALERKKLFILDYHDLLLPYVKKVSELEGTTLYGSRTLFFLTNDGTLRPIAIELTRPPSEVKPQWKEVFTPSWDATAYWLWKLAKAHVLAHDSGYHELVSHWLRTHCCMEPYIIATNRQLSAMHPIHRLLLPHFRYTMEINALARQFLISAAGIIEISFTPGKYSMELSSAAYDQTWRFDMEALPADLIRRNVQMHATYKDFNRLFRSLDRWPARTHAAASTAVSHLAPNDINPHHQISKPKMEAYHLQYFGAICLEWYQSHDAKGMAVEDPTSEHGLKLTIEDYPFANDGLILWSTIKQWVTDYVNHYYPNPGLIQYDQELQSWWTEVRTKGHEDKMNEPWWPVLNTQDSLIQTLTTIIWVASAHHSAVNFGQYCYGGYFPNRPSIARTKMPTEDPTEEEFKNFMKKPETALLECFPSQIQATVVMAVLEVLSNHSPEEEYIGGVIEPAWDENPIVKAAFARFKGRLVELEGIINERNEDLKLKNRSGAGVVPYELLKPFSKPGVTGMGVPNSISI